MNVGIFLVGDNHEYHAMARLCVESVRTSMPGAEVYHLTDENTPAIEGVDATRCLSGAMPMAIRRMLHNASCEGEWLFIDCDVIVQQDVREVFGDKDFDVALTDRAGTITTEAKYAAVMPYNLGVTFSRSQQFWAHIAHHLKYVPDRFQAWEGDQRLVCEFMRQKKIPFKVKILPGRIYNFPPKSAQDDTSHAALVHFKGARKKYLLERAA